MKGGVESERASPLCSARVRRAVGWRPPSLVSSFPGTDRPGPRLPCLHPRPLEQQPLFQVGGGAGAMGGAHRAGRPPDGAGLLPATNRRPRAPAPSRLRGSGRAAPRLLSLSLSLSLCLHPPHLGVDTDDAPGGGTGPGGPAGGGGLGGRGAGEGACGGGGQGRRRAGGDRGLEEGEGGGVGEGVSACVWCLVAPLSPSSGVGRPAAGGPAPHPPGATRGLAAG